MISRVVEGNWRSEFQDALRRYSGELLIVSPFIKASVLAKLLANPPENIRVVTRFNLKDFAKGVSDTDALRQFLEAGAAVRGIRNLHAKLYMFGGSRAIVTSANLTGAGMGRNHEFGLVTEENGVVMACREYFEKLWKQAGSDLTDDALKKWDAEITGWRAHGGRFAAPDGLADCGTDIGLPKMPVHPGASVFDDRDQWFVKFLGQGHDRAALTRKVLAEVDRSGCHRVLGYPASKRPRSVRDGAVMFISRLVEGLEGNDIRVFGRGIGLAHVPGRDDATEEDMQLRPWKSTWPRYIRVHDTEFVDGTLANGVSLGELMHALGPDCFTSTARNAAAGQGNTNPHLAFMQQAAVQLTEAGAAWLTRELDQRFDEHGRVPQTKLRSLDWPVVPVEGG